MNVFEKRFVCERPMAYYIVLGSKEKGGDWLQIDPIITDRPVYAPEGKVAVFSGHGISQVRRIGTPFELLCLSCFFHHLRRGNRVRSAILDGQYCLIIRPWRAPCATTAIYTDNNETYYLEGCKEGGVFWRRGEERPKTEPPFISCGAFDSNAGCWGPDCPHDLYFEDDIE
jgi:hypothetical protein